MNNSNPGINFEKIFNMVGIFIHDISDSKVEKVVKTSRIG